MKFSFYNKREGFPYRADTLVALCTWHIWGSSDATFSTVLLLSWVSERHPMGLPPLEVLVSFEEAFVVLSPRFANRVNFIPNFYWLYSKMHNKILLLPTFPSLPAPPLYLLVLGAGQGSGSSFLQLLLTASSTLSWVSPEPVMPGNPLQHVLSWYVP